MGRENIIDPIEMNEDLNYENTTHSLKCRHTIGNNSFDYLMRCHILKKTKTGKLKILVFGVRYWKYTESCKRVRYVDKSRVLKNA